MRIMPAVVIASAFILGFGLAGCGDSTSTTRSTDSSLSALTVQVSGTDILTNFDPAMKSYPGLTTNCFDEYVEIAATPAAGATVRARNGSGRYAVIDGAIYKYLSVGANDFDLVVTAEDGATTTTYSLRITRSEPATTLAVTSPAEGGSLASGTSVAVSGTFSGTKPENIMCLIAGATSGSMPTISDNAWSATFDTSALTSGDSKYIRVIAFDSSSSYLGYADSTFTLTGGTMGGRDVSGVIDFSETPPASGKILLHLNRGGTDDRVVHKTITVTGAATYGYSFTGIPDGQYQVDACLIKADGSYFVDAPLWSGRVGQYPAPWSIDASNTTIPKVTLSPEF